MCAGDIGGLYSIDDTGVELWIDDDSRVGGKGDGLESGRGVAIIVVKGAAKESEDKCGKGSSATKEEVRRLEDESDKWVAIRGEKEGVSEEVSGDKEEKSGAVNVYS